MMRVPPRRTRQSGIVLVTAMIFLVVLTLVAVTSIKGSGLELRMSANNAMHVESLESSEAPRQMVSRLVEVLGFSQDIGGWPVSIGGETPDALFAYTLPTGMTILDGNDADSAPDNWFDYDPINFNYTGFIPRATFSVNAASSGTSNYTVSAQIAVQQMRDAPKIGCGQAMSQGFEGLGNSAKNCQDLFLYITSRGQDPTGQALYETSAVYRYVPRQ